MFVVKLQQICKDTYLTFFFTLGALSALPMAEGR